MTSRREEYKRQKELEAARKAGTAAPEVDEHGKAIDPHIPSFISKAPWYIQSDTPTLSHQTTSRTNVTASTTGTVRQRLPSAVTTASASADANTNTTNYTEQLPTTTETIEIVDQLWRKRTARNSSKNSNSHISNNNNNANASANNNNGNGECTNCGMNGHRAKDCLEKPRAKGANQQKDGRKLRQKSINEAINLELDYEAKRDRHKGYNPNEYMDTIEQWNIAESKQQSESAQQGNNGEKTLKVVGKRRRRTTKHSLDSDSSDSDSDDDDGNDNDNGNGNGGTGNQVEVVRQSTGTGGGLRIREDTAKYLLNLDVDSAYYDPKSRTMRENPFENSGKSIDELKYAGDNILKHSGAVKDVNLIQKYAWDMSSKNDRPDLVQQANPTRTEMSFKKHTTETASRNKRLKQEILDMYS
ncbi:hypothetical protein GQ42DRAFT_163833 [Ramicandelaber brevisporus]|nr:hypothetical protein GQ42DRAFT_163833 [Ramicandelaber brevisporus]